MRFQVEQWLAAQCAPPVSSQQTNPLYSKACVKKPRSVISCLGIFKFTIKQETYS